MTSVSVASLLLSAHLAVAPVPSTAICEMSEGVVAAAGAAVTADSTLEALYASGVTWDEFLAAARARREQWVRNWTDAQVEPDVLAQAQALQGSYRMLVVAVDGCSDSVNTVPYLARLSALVPTISMRIITPDAGKPATNLRRTPDGRAATPTIILLDSAGNEVGCLIERPSELVRLGAEARTAGTYDDFISKKQAWYTNDAGRSTVSEVVQMLVASVGGQARCTALKPAESP